MGERRSTPERQSCGGDRWSGIREILKTAPDEEISVIVWHRRDTPPENSSYVLIKLRNPDGETVSCTGGAYESGRFLYYYYDGTVEEVEGERVLGWSYYPFDDRMP